MSADLLPELLRQHGYAVQRGDRLDLSHTKIAGTGKVYPMEITGILKVARRTTVFVVATAIYREGNHIDRDVVEIIQARVTPAPNADTVADGLPDSCYEEEKRCAKLILGYHASPLAHFVVPAHMYSSDVAERVAQAVVEACTLGDLTHGSSLS